jgi:methionine-rich copper-binding protein CopC
VLHRNTRHTSRFVRTPLYLMLAWAMMWTLIASPRAYAHAELTQSTPEANSVQTVAPTEVFLRFSQPLDASGSRFTVTGPDGTPVNQGDSQVVATDQTSMSVLLLPNLADGVYSVQWTSLSAEDGDESTGSFTFTVATGTQPAPAPVVPDTTTSQPDTTQQQPTSPLPTTAADPRNTPSLAIAGCLLLVIAGLEFRRRSRIAAERAAYAQDMDS